VQGNGRIKLYVFGNKVGEKERKMRVGIYFRDVKKGCLRFSVVGVRKKEKAPDLPKGRKRREGGRGGDRV